MINTRNPFEYEAANKFTSGEIIGFFIPDYSYSRLVNSKRNIFLVGGTRNRQNDDLAVQLLPPCKWKSPKEPMHVRTLD